MEPLGVYFPILNLIIIDLENLHAIEPENERTSPEEFEEFKQLFFGLLKRYVQAYFSKQSDIELLKILQEDEFGKIQEGDRIVDMIHNAFEVLECISSKDQFEQTLKEKDIDLKSLRSKANENMKSEDSKECSDGKLQLLHIEAISILDKMIHNRKMSDKVITDFLELFCISEYSGFSQSPLHFLYKLITYLHARKREEMLVKVFRKIEEEGVIWPKIWPKSKELIAIRESLDFSKYPEEEEVLPGGE